MGELSRFHQQIVENDWNLYFLVVISKEDERENPIEGKEKWRSEHKLLFAPPDSLRSLLYYSTI